VDGAVSSLRTAGSDLSQLVKSRPFENAPLVPIAATVGPEVMGRLILLSHNYALDGAVTAIYCAKSFYTAFIRQLP
jgi:hypothetical protein